MNRIFRSDFERNVTNSCENGNAGIFLPFFRTPFSSVMALCCIGGVCIPYTALVPLLIYGLQWLLQKLAAAGFLPETAFKYLKGLISLPPACDKKINSSEASSCCERTSFASNARRGKQNKQSFTNKVSSVSTNSFCSSDEVQESSCLNYRVQIIESSDEWEQLFTENLSVTIICKFTADWCKPCKGIQPMFESFAISHGSSTIKFVSVDVDVLEDVAATYRVVSLPTILVIKGGRVTEKYSGSNEDSIRELIANACEVS